MQDYQRQEYVARERVLHPEVFGVTKEQSQLMERVNNAPMYINKTPQVIVKSSSQISIKAREGLCRRTRADGIEDIYA